MSKEYQIPDPQDENTPSLLENVEKASAEGTSLHEQPPKPPLNLQKEILSWVITIAAAVLAALLIRTFVFVPVKVEGSSMADTLQNQEMVFVTKFDYLFGTPKRQDVVICHYPNRSYKVFNLFTRPQNFVKRVIGLPGDTIEIKYDPVSNKQLIFINEELLEEPYLTDDRHRSPREMEPVTLGEDEYFVIGDNRDNSNDSRNLSEVGPIHKKDIVGHVRFVFFPFRQWRVIH